MTHDQAGAHANDDDVKKVNDYKKRVIDEGEKLLLCDIPKKIIELDELLKTKPFQVENICSIYCDTGIPVPSHLSNNCNSGEEAVPGKKCRLDNDVDHAGGSTVYAISSGVVPCNKHILDIIQRVKPIIRQLLEDSNLMKMWISFMIPKIEDGNNFGVSVQEDSLGEVRAVESEAAAYFGQLTKYFASRAKIVSKLAKFPHIEDYRQTIRELDENKFVSLRLMVSEMRNNYSTVHDLITKNLDKIRKPRSENVDSMY